LVQKSEFIAWIHLLSGSQQLLSMVIQLQEL